MAEYLAGFKDVDEHFEFTHITTNWGEKRAVTGEGGCWEAQRLVVVPVTLCFTDDVWFFLYFDISFYFFILFVFPKCQLTAFHSENYTPFLTPFRPPAHGPETDQGFSKKEIKIRSHSETRWNKFCMLEEWQTLSCLYAFDKRYQLFIVLTEVCTSPTHLGMICLFSLLVVNL